MLHLKFMGFVSKRYLGKNPNIFSDKHGGNIMVINPKVKKKHHLKQIQDFGWIKETL